MSELRAGFGKRDITPQLPVAVQGHLSRPQPAKELVGHLETQSIAFSWGAMNVLILSVDALELSREFCNSVRSTVSVETGVPEEHIIVSATHTHTAPATITLGSMIPDQQFLSSVRDRLIECAVEATCGMEPATLELTTTKATGLGVNRRMPRNGTVRMAPNFNGKTDDSLAALTMQLKRSERRGMIVFFALHPTALGVHLRVVSPDFPGALKETLRKQAGVESVMFINGAAGDVRPNLVGNDGEFREGSIHDMERIGNTIASALIAATSTPISLSDLPLSIESRELSMSFVENLSATDFDRHAERHAKMIRELEDREDSAARDGQDRHINRLAAEREFAKWAHQMEQARRRDALPTEFRTRISVLGFGSIAACVFLPGEQFTDTALRIKGASPFDHTVVCGYANGAAGYVPTAEALRFGGYEVEEAYKFYGMPAPYAADAAERVVDGAMGLLDHVLRSDAGSG